MAWTEEQTAALQQIISDGKSQGLSSEEIQAQIDAKRQEFKTVKPTTTQQDSGVDADENGSIMESDLESGSSVSTKQKKPDWRPVYSKSGNILNARDRDLSEEEIIKKKEVESNILELNSSVGEKEIEEARADQYFKLDERPTVFVRGTPGTQTPGSYQPMPVEEYLGKDKYKQYVDFLENGEIQPLDANNAEYLVSLGPGSVATAQQKATEVYLRGVDQIIIDNLDFFGNDKEFKSEEEANKFLDKQYDFIQEKNNELAIKYDAYDEQTATYKTEFDNLNKQLNEIESKFSEDFFGNISPDSPEDARAYQDLVAKAQVLEDQFVEKGFEDLYNSLIKTQNDNNYLVEQYREKSKKYQELRLLKEQLD